MKTFKLIFKNGTRKTVKAENIGAAFDQLRTSHPFQNWGGMLNSLIEVREITHKVQVSDQTLNKWVDTNYGGRNEHEARAERERLCLNDSAWIAPASPTERFRRTRIVPVA